MLFTRLLKVSKRDIILNMKEKEDRSGRILKLFNLWLPVVFWALIIFSFSAQTTPSISEVHWQDFIFKKTIHMIEYGIFATLWFRAFKGSGIEKIRALYYSFFLASFYGASDEFHQSFTPGREPRLRDTMIDAFGAFIFLLFIEKILPRTNSRIIKLARYFGLTDK